MTDNSNTVRPRKRQLLHEPPSGSIETEADREIKRLADNQLRVTGGLEWTQNQFREFSAPITYKPVTQAIEGELPLSEYAKLDNIDNEIHSLRALGLSNDEIRLKLLADGKIEKRKESNVSVAPDIRTRMLDEISVKIVQANKQKETEGKGVSGSRILSRQEMDLERAVNHKQRGLLNLMFKGTKERIDNDSSGLLMESVKEMENELKLKSKIKSEAGKSQTNCSDNPLSLEEPQLDGDDFPDINYESPIGPMKEKQYLRPVALDDASTNRMSLEDLKMIPKFKNYQEGEPNNVLYVKNLPKGLEQMELESIFHTFKCEDKPFDCRLLAGKMRGQAFVTLSDVARAKQALDTLNGYLIKGRPMVITYGKRKVII